MTRDAVEALLRTGHRWRIYYCEGGKQLPEDGSGHTLPAGILREVPTPAQWRKYLTSRTLDPSACETRMAISR
jgi:hypothetical protein